MHIYAYLYPYLYSACTCFDRPVHDKINTNLHQMLRQTKKEKENIIMNYIKCSSQKIQISLHNKSRIL